jgi:hypothetical protein
MRRWTWWWIFLGLLTISRWLAAQSSGLSAGEAYFWLLGSHWEWASFEGPGGLPGLVALLGEWFGANPLVLRALGPLWVLLGSLGLWWWGGQLRGPLLGFWLTVFWNVLPAVNAQSLFFGPDLAAATFWIWSLALAWKAAHQPTDGGFWWLLTGLITALGCLFSYALLLLPLSLLLFFILDQHFWSRLAWWRKSTSPARRSPPRLTGSSLWVFLLPATALIGPILWHISTDWVALAGQTWQSLIEFGGAKILSTLLLATQQSGGLALLLFFFALLGQVWLSPSSRESRWFLAMTLLPAIWLVGALWRGDTDLALPLLLALPVPALWLTNFLVEAAGEHGSPRVFRRRWMRSLGLVTLLASALAALALLLQPPTLREPDWAELGERVERLARIYQPAGASPLFLVSDSADAAAGMGFFLLSRETGPQRDFPPVFVRESQNLASQFGLWPRYDQFLDAEEDDLNPLFLEQQGINPYLGRSAIYIGQETPTALPQTISNGFLRVVPLEKITDPGGRVFFLYFCEDYQTAPL